MSLLSILDIFKIEKRGQAPGQAIVGKSKDSDEFTTETEFYQLPGFESGPTKGDRLIIVKTEGGYEVIVASHSYKIAPNVKPGELRLYSSDANGSAKIAELYFENDGEITLSTGNAGINIKPNGETTVDADAQNLRLRTTGKVIVDQASAVEFMGSTRTLVTHTELNAALQGLITAVNALFGGKLDGSGTVGSLTLDISAAEATKLKTGSNV